MPARESWLGFTIPLAPKTWASTSESLIPFPQMPHQASYLLLSLVDSTRNYNLAILLFYSFALCSLSILDSRTFANNSLGEHCPFIFVNISKHTFEHLLSSYF